VAEFDTLFRSVARGREKKDQKLQSEYLLFRQNFEPVAFLITRQTQPHVPSFSAPFFFQTAAGAYVKVCLLACALVVVFYWVCTRAYHT
jgi:hypothetical protein